MDTTITGFEAYQLTTWATNGLVMTNPTKDRDWDTRPIEKRSMPWTMQVAASVTIGIAAAVFSPSSESADTFSGQTRAAGATLPAPTSLSALFRAMGSGQMKPQTAELRALSERAAQYQGSTITDLTSWAARLSSDVKDAKD